MQSAFNFHLERKEKQLNHFFPLKHLSEGLERLNARARELSPEEFYHLEQRTGSSELVSEHAFLNGLFDEIKIAFLIGWSSLLVSWKFSYMI